MEGHRGNLCYDSFSMKPRTPRTGILLYLLLNIVVSAATTLGVLTVWDRARQSQLPPVPTFLPTAPVAASTEVTPDQAGTPTPLAALVGPQIEINTIIGATDPKLEYVLLKRMGEGDLNLAGWTLSNEHEAVFTFPDQPALVLYKGGAVQIYTRSGTDTPTEMFWNLSDAAWRPGEWATLKDKTGKVQARYQVP
jgi:hypothetical protein